MSDLKETKDLDLEEDILAEEPGKKKSIFGSTKKAKIINGVCLGVLVAVVIWCALYQLHII